MGARDTEIRQEMATVLMTRVRAAIVVCLVATLTVSLASLLIEGFSRFDALLARVVIAAALIALLRQTEESGWREAVQIALLVVLLYALVSALGLHIPGDQGRVYLLVALAMGASAYLPWGAGPQALCAGTIFAVLVIREYMIGDLGALQSNQLVGFFGVLGLSVLISRELHRQSIARVTEQLARREKEQALEAEVKVSSALVRVGRELLSVADSPELLERLCRLTAEELHCDSSHTFLWSASDDAFACIAGYGDAPEQREVLRVLRVPARLFRPVLERINRDGITHTNLGEMEALGAGALASPLGVQSSLFLALRRREETLGVLTAGRRDSDLPFTLVEQRIARGIAHFATLSLQNLHLVESLRQANTLKSDFVATMSHELRTPLHILMGYSDLMMEGEFGDLNSEQCRILGLMDNSAHELLDLINTTLDLSRLDAGRVRVDVRECSVRAVLTEVETELISTIRNHPEIVFSLHCDQQLPPLETDAAKLKVILKNLIGNAFKFTDRGSIEVRAKMCDGGMVFEVSDTGIGIAPDVQSVIFEPFQQGEASLTRSRGGVGLGLYIVRRLLGLLNGKVTLTRTGPRGTTFEVWLPVQPAASEETDTPPARRAARALQAARMVAQEQSR